MTKQSGFPDADRPARPSKETSRLAAALASLATDYRSGSPADPFASNWDDAPLVAKVVEDAIRARRLRAEFVAPDLADDAPWDMLLELLHAEIMRRRLGAPDLCTASGLPTSVGLRWIEALVSKGLCSRCAHAGDDKAAFVELSDQGREAMREYFTTLAESGTGPLRETAE